MKGEIENGKPEENGEAREVSLAEQEFINYCEANEIDHSEEDMDDDSREDFLKIKKRFMKAVNGKRLVVDGTKLIYTVSKFSPSSGEQIAVCRPAGRDFMAMDGFKDTQQMQKFNAFIASMCGKDKSYISRLDIADRQILQDVGTLFLAG
jgi:hypothetical protein